MQRSFMTSYAIKQFQLSALATVIDTSQKCINFGRKYWSSITLKPSALDNFLHLNIMVFHTLNDVVSYLRVQLLQ